MKVAHIVLGRRWLFYERVQCDDYENTYTFVSNGHKKILHPMKEVPILKQQEEKLESLEPEESSNTLIEKELEVASKEEEIINDESRMQEVMELNLEQSAGELKEVVKAPEEPMFNIPRQNIIMIGSKHEESYDE